MLRRRDYWRAQHSGWPRGFPDFRRGERPLNPLRESVDRTGRAEKAGSELGHHLAASTDIGCQEWKAVRGSLQQGDRPAFVPGRKDQKARATHEGARILHPTLEPDASGQAESGAKPLQRRALRAVACNHEAPARESGERAQQNIDPLDRNQAAHEEEIRSRIGPRWGAVE